MANQNNTNANQVTEATADAIHQLLTECMETSLREQLITGDINPAMIGKVIDYLKHNDIKVVAKSNKALSSLSDLVAQIDLDSL